MFSSSILVPEFAVLKQVVLLEKNELENRLCCWKNMNRKIGCVAEKYELEYRLCC